jgi:Rrf2 family transcriptional regulator, iron-sulfur cluster assembly transcription factor
MYLALKTPGEKTSIRELTKKMEIPYHFLAKILQDLTYKGFLVSQKGPTGGFALGKSPKEITLLDIVEAIDGEGFRTECVLGFPECTGKHPCAVHEKWGTMRESLREMLAKKNIAEMAKDMKKPEYKAAVA